MPSDFTRERVAAIATLANLELDPSEVEMFARQLADILAYADEVQRVDTTGVPPTTTVATGGGADRDDEVDPSRDLGDALANAPDALRNPALFRVPRVLS